MQDQRAIQRLLALPDYLRITEVVTHNSEPTSLVTLALTSVRHFASCPECQRRSRRVHSHYDRTLADLPIADHNVSLRIQVHRFFCDNRRCKRKVFAERLPDLTQPYARRTCRQKRNMERIGHALGGRAGAELAEKLEYPTSFKTLLRFVVASRCPDRPTPRVLGVDDWAFRKGRKYGTILYDLETHQPVDLLADRTAESLSAWLKAHPGVEIISRDRASAYSEGAREGAPDAVQVADRFHLIKNLGDALERLLNRKPALLKQAAQQINSLREPTTLDSAVPEGILPSGLLPREEVSDKVSRKPLRQSERTSQRLRLQRYLRYEKVKELHREGHNRSQIATIMQLDPHTVGKFVRAQTFPERAARRGASRLLDGYQSYLKQRFREGCHNARTLWKEVRTRGYPGGYSMLAAYVQTLRQPSKAGIDGTTSQTAKVVCTVHDVVRAILRPESERTLEEKSMLDRLDHLWEAFRRFHASAKAFIDLVRAPKQRDQSEALRAWMATAAASEVSEMVSFAAGIKRDRDAVIAGLSLPWSNGAVEGSINRLKMIKRQMYGRAGFPLLRRRVLEPTCAAVGHHRE